METESKTKKQIVVIHGGDTFANYEEYLDFLRGYEIDIERLKSDKIDWKPWLRRKLAETHEVILPVMPNKTNAQFEEWEIWFEKLFPFLNDEVVLIGHSLGGSFLAKYLSENGFPKKISAVFLIAAVHDEDTDGYGLATFALPEKLNLQTEKIYLYHSEDDPTVAFTSLAKFQKVLPTATARVFEDRQHFNQEELPELVEDIISL